MSWFIIALKKYAVFSGRARRAEFWYFNLFILLLSIAFQLLDWALGLNKAAGGFAVFSLIFALATLLPSLAVAVRRLHDTGRRGWWILIALVPLVGIIVLLVFYVQDSQPGENQYGPNPKAA
jgi:uncharacterized membrane protein YhaH (DUF805 family)